MLMMLMLMMMMCRCRYCLTRMRSLFILEFACCILLALGQHNKHAPFIIIIIINISVAAASRALPCPAGGASEANASTDCAVPGSVVSSPVLPSGRSPWNLHTYIDGCFPT